MLKIGALVSGGGTNLQSIIDSIENGNIPNAEIVTVVSSKQEAYALTRAKNHSINGVCIRESSFDNANNYEDALITHFKSFDCDLIIMAGFMVVIGSKFIKAYENKIMNVHPSLIPSFCGDGFYGLKVHEAAIKKGVKVTGATVHFVNEETDGGPIILQKSVCVNEDDTPKSLQQRVMEEAEWIIYPEAIKLFSQDKIKIVRDLVKIV